MFGDRSLSSSKKDRQNIKGRISKNDLDSKVNKEDDDSRAPREIFNKQTGGATSSLSRISLSRNQVSDLSQIRQSPNITDLERGDGHQKLKYDRVEEILQKSRQINKQLIPQQVS